MSMAAPPHIGGVVIDDQGLEEASVWAAQPIVVVFRLPIIIRSLINLGPGRRAGCERIAKLERTPRVGTVDPLSEDPAFDALLVTLDSLSRLQRGLHLSYG